jgi:hypothetical protein
MQSQKGDNSDDSDNELNLAPDPFYDPTIDDYDELWIQSQFNPHSDAVLECPACFTTLCYDCQKHVEYEQYRAMFVRNCKVVRDQVLRTGDGESYHPVVCTCGFEVAVFDEEEIFHFFDVIAHPPLTRKEP